MPILKDSSDKRHGNPTDAQDKSALYGRIIRESKNKIPRSKIKEDFEHVHALRTFFSLLDGSSGPSEGPIFVESLISLLYKAEKSQDPGREELIQTIEWVSEDKYSPYEAWERLDDLLKSVVLETFKFNRLTPSMFESKIGNIVHISRILEEDKLCLTINLNPAHDLRQSSYKLAKWDKLRFTGFEHQIDTYRTAHESDAREKFVRAINRAFDQSSLESSLREDFLSAVLGIEAQLSEGKYTDALNADSFPKDRYATRDKGENSFQFYERVWASLVRSGDAFLDDVERIDPALIDGILNRSKNLAKSSSEPPSSFYPAEYPPPRRPKSQSSERVEKRKAAGRRRQAAYRQRQDELAPK